MGLLRFLFAFSVLIQHSNPLSGYTLVGREPAIRGFFIISGFYMALILNEKYTHKANSYLLFLSNRFLRIYPIYWIVLLLTITASFIYYALGLDYGIAHYASFYQHAHSVVFFYAHPLDVLRDVTLIVRTDYLTINPDKAQYLVIGQAYTLILELMFYILAPFIVRRGTKTLVILIGLSLAIRLLTFVVLRLHHEPLTDRFFPAELAYFLFGALAYRLYAKIKHKTIPPLLLFGISVGVLSMTLLYPFIPLHYHIRWIEVKDWLYFALLTGAIPFLFLMTAKKKVDKFIGDLSYPIYISHLLIYLVLKNTHLLNISTSWFTVELAVATIIFSQALILLIDKPINAYRQYRVKKAALVAEEIRVQKRP